MICEHPIYIVNSTKRYNGQLVKIGFHVPCGKCESCRQAMRDEWFVRAYAEYMDCVEKGGKVYFPTLTYAPESLPLFNTKTGKLCHGEKKYGQYDYCVPCFSKHDVQRYINTMRKTFERLGIKGVRYLICSEFGEQKGRPHYHALIFVPKNNLGDAKVESIILDSWKFGISSWSPLGSEVKSLKGVLYVTKYCTKDLNFTEEEHIKNYGLHSKRHANILKEYMPKHYQSKGFGLDLYDWLMKKENIEDYIDRGIGANYLGLEAERSYPIPRYIRNKIMYTTDKDGVRIPTDMGYLVSMKLLHIRIERAMRNYSKFFTLQGLQSKIDDTDCHEVIRHIGKFQYSNDFRGLHQYFLDKLNGRSLRELAIFNYCFRDRLIGDDLEELNEINTFTEDELETIGFNLVDISYDNDYYDFYSVSASKLGLFADGHIWNEAERFHGFDELLEVFQRVNSLASKRRQRKKVKDNKVINKLKNNLI